MTAGGVSNSQRVEDVRFAAFAKLGGMGDAGNLDRPMQAVDALVKFGFTEATTVVSHQQFHDLIDHDLNLMLIGSCQNPLHFGLNTIARFYLR